MIQHISIIICTYNGKQKLHDTLAHIAALQVPPNLLSVELLLVDNHSEDGTAAFVQDRWNQLDAPFALHIIHEQKSGKAHALTTGYNAAKGDIIILCDDDNWLQKDYLVHAKNLFDAHSEIGLAGGYGNKAMFINDEQPEWFDQVSRYYVVGTPYTKSQVLTKGDYSIYGAGSVLKKAAWDKIYKAGFRFQNSTNGTKRINDRYFGRRRGAMAEDVELCRAIAFAGFKLYIDLRLTYIHDLRWGRISKENLIYQEKLHGEGNVYLMVYEFIYNRVPCNFLWLRFLKDYIMHFIELNKEIKIVNKPQKDQFQLKELIDIAFKKSKRKYMILLFPEVIFKYRFIKTWIQKLAIK